MFRIGVFSAQVTQPNIEDDAVVGQTVVNVEEGTVEDVF